MCSRSRSLTTRSIRNPPSNELHSTLPVIPISDALLIGGHTVGRLAAVRDRLTAPDETVSLVSLCRAPSDFQRARRQRCTTGQDETLPLRVPPSCPAVVSPPISRGQDDRGARQGQTRRFPFVSPCRAPLSCSLFIWMGDLHPITPAISCGIPCCSDFISKSSSCSAVSAEAFSNGSPRRRASVTSMNVRTSARMS